MQCYEFSIMADISGKEKKVNSVTLKSSKCPINQKKHSTNQNEIAFKK